MLAAGDPRQSHAQSALAALCEIYWFPVYAFVRRTGCSPDDARDLTQAFFARVIEKGYFAEARQERGRFRAFLLTALRHFLSNERDAANALKRGGGAQHVPLEVDDGERRYSLEPVQDETPEHIFERRWALTVLDAGLARVAARYDTPDRQKVLATLKPLLPGRDGDSYADAAESLGLTEGALRVALHRLRRQFAASLRDVIAETVGDSSEVEEELRHLLAAVSRRPGADVTPSVNRSS